MLILLELIKALINIRRDRWGVIIPFVNYDKAYEHLTFFPFTHLFRSHFDFKSLDMLDQMTNQKAIYRQNLVDFHCLCLVRFQIE